jgi:alcohol dehydrogenase
VVTDMVVSQLPFFKKIIEKLSESGMEVSVFSEVPPEPPMDITEKILATSNNPEVVLAVGGGSVIDAAKAAFVKLVRPDVNIKDVAPFNPLGLEKSGKLLIAVPTTAGTGSDVSYGIVLKEEVEGIGPVKIAVGSYEVIPYASILDPQIPAQAPRKLKAGAGVDAVTHSVEAVVSTQSNPFSDALAFHAYSLLLKYLPEAVEGSLEAMEKVHAAATMAGIAFTNGGLGIVHAMAHSIGGLIKTHHGTTVGILLPYVLDIYVKDETAREKLTLLGKTAAIIAGLEVVHVKEQVLSLYEKIGFPVSFKDLGVDETEYFSAVEKVIGEVYHDPEIAYSPIIPGEEEIKETYRRAYYGVLHE